MIRIGEFYCNESPGLCAIQTGDKDMYGIHPGLGFVVFIFLCVGIFKLCAWLVSIRSRLIRWARHIRTSRTRATSAGHSICLG